jgi:lipoyl(octanoyl) transferase
MKTSSTIFEDLGLIDYKKAWDYQEERFKNIVDCKLRNRKNTDAPETIVHHLIFCEHPHVFTLGKSGAANNLLIPDDLLKKIKASLKRFHPF